MQWHKVTNYSVGNYVIEASIIIGDMVGHKALILRMIVTLLEVRIPFKM